MIKTATKRFICFTLLIVLAVSGNVYADSNLISLDDNVYNLVTSFIGDASNSRGFAWTAVDGYENMQLDYAKKGESNYSSVVPTVVGDKGTHLYYKADITGLEAGTTYTYKIGDTIKNEWYGPFEFTTKEESLDSFSFIGMSDPQGSVEADYEYFRKNVEAAIQDDPNAAFVVNWGDLVNNGYNENQWKWHLDAISKYCTDVPYMGVVGNHDVFNPTEKDPSFDELWDSGENFKLHLNHPNNGTEFIRENLSVEDMTTPWFTEILENIDDTVYSFDYGNAHFAVINTAGEINIASSYGPDYRNLMQVQRDWLSDDLENTDAKWKIVLLHMGGYRADTWRSDIATIEYFGDIIDNNDVDLVLQGHDHIYMRTYPIFNKEKNEASDEINSTISGTTYTILGAAANKRYTDSQLKGPDEYVYIREETSNDQPVYCLFDINDERISVTAKQLDGTVLDEYTIQKGDFEDVEIDAGTDEVVVQGILGGKSTITVIVTYPEVQSVESGDDICYINQLETNSKGGYYFDFSDRNKSVGEYKILMNISGIISQYRYGYQPKIYMLEGQSKIEKLSDISGNSLTAKAEIINIENGRLYCAQYYEGKLKDVKFVDVSKGASGGMTISYMGSSEVDEIKLFFWDYTSIIPSVEPVTIY